MSRDLILGRALPVLGEGFVRVEDVMGDQTSIVRAARVSYGKGTKSVREDRGLLRYLMRHRHSTPFEMAEIALHVKMPIFVARQWHRHRTASINEYSARFSELDAGFYLPGLDDMEFQDKANKQGGDGLIDPAIASHVIDEMAEDMGAAFDHYRENVADPKNGGVGLAREMARISLPLATWTEFYWKLDAHNLLHFLSLRMDPHAQPAIRAYAHAIAGIVKDWLPAVWEAFEDYRLESHTFSGPEMRVLRRLLRHVNHEGQNAREVAEKLIQWPEFRMRDDAQVISEREIIGFLKVIADG